MQQPCNRTVTKLGEWRDKKLIFSKSLRCYLMSLGYQPGCRMLSGAFRVNSRCSNKVIWKLEGKRGSF